jgi:hypothetical protein
MSHSRLREFQRGEFCEPAHFLAGLRAVEPEISASLLSPHVKHLRTNGLKEWREARGAALFCHGMAQRIGQPIFMSRSEQQDYDFVACWTVDGTQHFAPVQLKEVVPESLNPNTNIEQVVQSLTKYVDSEDPWIQPVDATR